MSGEESGTCVFCRIVAGQAPADRVGENERALAILDIHPFAAGHTLVISKRHVPWWHDLTPEETADVFALARDVAGRIRKAFDPEFVALYARGRRIPHTHIFLVPTVTGDVLDRFYSGLEKVQETSEELAALRQPAAREEAARRIREMGASLLSSRP
ncbi:MAG TPA: HIT family protein [Thermoanaerobaculia bacterium]